MASKVWTERENQYLRDHFESMSNPELGEKFGVSRKSIEAKLRKLGLRRKKPVKKVKKKSRKLSGQKAAKKKPVKPSGPYENVRCRICLMVDGYMAEEDKCRYCGAKLFRGDVI